MILQCRSLGLQYAQRDRNEGQKIRNKNDIDGDTLKENVD